MVVLVFFLAGFGIGWWRATARSPLLADRLQFALAHAIPAAIAGAIVSVVALNLGA